MASSILALCGAPADGPYLGFPLAKGIRSKARIAALGQYHDVLIGEGPRAGVRPPPARLPIGAKLVLLGRIWITYLVVQLELRRHPLARVVIRMSRPGRATAHYEPMRLSRAVTKGLRIGKWQPRCLIRSLVLYRLLRAQGDRAQLVIGLPGHARTSDAHAWIELDGRDVGPLPGRKQHEELARFPLELDLETKPLR